MKTLIVTVGLPRAGKSTWAAKTGYPVVNPDAIRLALHGQPFNAAAEPMVWAVAQYMVRALFLAGHNTVVVDATNTTQKRRDMWKSPDWETRFRVFNVGAFECSRRAEATGRSDLLPVIERMNREYEPLGDTEEVIY